MKILPIVHSPSYSLKNNSKPNYLRYEAGVDTFQKTTNFRGGISQTASQPKLDKLAKLMVTTGAVYFANFLVSLKKSPEGNEILNNPEESKKVTGLASEFFSSVFAQANCEETCDDITPQINDENFIKTEESEEHSAQSMVHKSKEIESTEPAKEKKVEDADKKELFKEFPKKVGRLTSNQEKLKDITSGLTLNDEYTSKLIFICQELLQKNQHKINEEVYDNNDVTIMLCDDLSNEENVPETVIDKYHALLSSETINAEPIENSGLKVLGKIALPKKPITDEECLQNSEINEEAPYTINFKIPGSNSAYSLQEILRMMLVQYEKNLSNNDEEFVRWMYNRPISRDVDSKAIINEIKKQNRKKDEDAQPYKNITVDDADVIADLIKSDERFSELFSTHAAVRFFERFIDFEGENIDKQCKEKLDALELLIKTTEKEDGIIIEKYAEKDSKNQEIVGSRITLFPNKYGQYFIDKLGSFPIVIGICENQPADYYKKRNKQPLIQTIWPIGA